MKKIFIVLFIVFTAIFLMMFFGAFDKCIPVKTHNTADDGNILHEEFLNGGESKEEDEELLESKEEDEALLRNDKENDKEDEEYIKADVERVVDGDTIVVTTGRRDEFKVRYIGIDTPESVHSDESKNTEEGKIASNRNNEIISDAGNTVYLEYDVQETDKYGRSLCYVYIKENGAYKMVQEMLLSEGMCQVMTIQPNSKNADKFYELQEKARKEEKGFWKADFFS